MGLRASRSAMIVLAGLMTLSLMPTVGAVAQAGYSVYLPLTTHTYRPSGQILGRLLFHGAPEVGATIELVNYTVSPPAENGVVTATTTATGDFAFETPLPLSVGDRYYLRYTNPTLDGAPEDFDVSRVLTWTSFDLPAYDYDEQVTFPTIDVGSVELNLNLPTVAVPYQFSWGRRALYPDESYDFMLTDQASVFHGSAPLGYSDHYDLSSLPTGFALDTPYVWGVHIVSPWAGEGYSFFYTVMFGETGGTTDLVAPTTYRVSR